MVTKPLPSAPEHEKPDVHPQLLWCLRRPPDRETCEANCLLKTVNPANCSGGCHLKIN